MMLSIDPGLNAIGWACFEEVSAITAPCQAGVISVPNHIIRQTAANWEKRIAIIMDEVEALDYFGMFNRVVVEWPEFRDGAVGRAAAARGNLTQLAFCCGAVHQMARKCGARFGLMPVSRWKGQLPKDVVEARITRAIGQTDLLGREFKTHAWDAVGLGLVALGHRLDDAKKFGKGAKR